jgi:DNA-binding NtrC family response regulator
VLAVLQKYHWPGNIRELENLIKRYVILGHEEVITNDLVAREPDFLQSGDQSGRADFSEENDAPVRARTGAQGHPEGAATASLEPQAGSPHTGHQLSRPALQDPRRRPALEPRSAPAAKKDKNAEKLSGYPRLGPKN